MKRRLVLTSLVVLLGSHSSHATEVEFQGEYRARAQAFDTLSLDRELDDSEGLSMGLDHRLILRPRFLLSDRVALNVDIKGMDNLTWGTRATDPSSVVPNAAPTYESILTSPYYDPNASGEDGTAALQDITLWHAWGQVHTGIGTFRFGRMPLHWGAGLWLNDGMQGQTDFNMYGDTADRIQWDYLVMDQFYVRLAADVHAERFLNDVDDTTAFNAALAYQTETVVAGLHTQLQHRVNGGADTGQFDLFTVDVALDAELGKLNLVTETVGQFGAGDLSEDYQEVQVSAIGSILRASMDLRPWMATVEGGIATGDGTNDQSLRTFTFDRDYTVGLMMFEQPMPSLAAALATETNGNRSYEQALLGNAVSNALYLKPTLGRQITDGFQVHASWLGARTAKVPQSFGDRNSYGMEFQLGAQYTGIDHVDFGFLFGTFLPGSYFENLPDDTYPAFNAPAFGAQISSRIHF